MRRLIAASAALVLAFGLTACSGESDDLAELYKQGTNQGFISADGRVQEIPADERGEPLVFTGTAVDGSTISSGDFAGEVVVLNFWYAGCGPCRAEAPILEQVHSATAPDGAHFVGVNIYDGPEQAAAFEQTWGITYPSLLIREDAELKLVFATWTSVQATPTTLVLDKQGRVAARFVGAIRSESILRSIVTDAIAEQS